MTVSRFWRKIPHRYNLIGTHCTNCGEYYFPPRQMCPTCRRDGKIESYQFEGKGEVITYTVIHTAAKGYANQVPYNLAIIKLNEGPSLTGQVICEPGELEIGTRVRSVFRKLGEESEKGMIYYGTKFVVE
ncbi:MAG: Zn-ribbon domain-containing OB-fold protein [ANME-2 cluster archaeon]|nr:Zn-ribbon domain-containing OB-fold protein [ANME-2 cluster archaeon]MBC2701942.1 Zn-ribbon domain-containing OB-fold protein [ANME-2 cluster archaeon]MBC2707798.1 Zn-ribbon domain-containing OB-fold protein [ANME-2 cluster archaeon]